MSDKDLAGFLRRRMRELELTNVDVARRAGLARQTWHRLLSGDIGEAKLSTLVRIANALEIHPIQLVRTYFTSKQLSSSTEHQAKTKYNSGFIADVTYPDNSLVSMKQEFIKTWEIINLGTSSWEGLYLACVDDLPHSPQQQSPIQYGLLPERKSFPVPYTAPNETVRLSVKFKAPCLPCTVISHWKLVDQQGKIILPNHEGLYCLVKVVGL